jgi:hypothetical protein
MTPVDAVLRFLAAINRHDADQSAGLMTDDHVFIDSLGNSGKGRDSMRVGKRAAGAFRRGQFALVVDDAGECGVEKVIAGRAPIELIDIGTDNVPRPRKRIAGAVVQAIANHGAQIERLGQVQRDDSCEVRRR